MMDVEEVRICKKELQLKIAESFYDYEQTTGLHIDDVKFVRQSQYDNIGKEIGFKYIVEVKSYI